MSRLHTKALKNVFSVDFINKILIMNIIYGKKKFLHNKNGSGSIFGWNAHQNIGPTLLH